MSTQNNKKVKSVIMGQTTLEQDKILTTISGGIQKGLVKHQRPNIYYKPVNGKDLAVFMVIKEYDPRIEDKIYDVQAKTIYQYKDHDIEFRLTPKYKVAEKRIVPEGFKKLAFA